MQPDLARAVLLTDDLAQLLKLSIAAQLLDDKDGDGDGKLTREEWLAGAGFLLPPQEESPFLQT
jgi:hypothetical protein